MLFGPKLAELNARITEISGQLNAANGNVTALIGEKTTLEARVRELEEAQASAVTKADHDAAILLKDGEIARLRDELETAKAGVKTQVREQIASAGVPAIVRDPAAVDTLTKSPGDKAVSPKKRLAALFNEELAAKK